MKKILLTAATAALMLAACGEKKPSEQVLETRDKAVQQTRDAIDAAQKANEEKLREAEGQAGQ